jgi:hypothetical protein
METYAQEHTNILTIAYTENVWEEQKLNVEMEIHAQWTTATQRMGVSMSHFLTDIPAEGVPVKDWAGVITASVSLTLLLIAMTEIHAPEMSAKKAKVASIIPCLEGLVMMEMNVPEQNSILTTAMPDIVNLEQKFTVMITTCVPEMCVSQREDVNTTLKTASPVSTETTVLAVKTILTIV